MDIICFYQTNDDFRVYLDKYCDKHNLTVTEAVKHQIVKEQAKYYKDVETENARNIEMLNRK